MILESVAETRLRWAHLDHGTSPFVLSTSPTNLLPFLCLNQHVRLFYSNNHRLAIPFSPTRYHPSPSLVLQEL